MVCLGVVLGVVQNVCEVVCAAGQGSRGVRVCRGVVLTSEAEKFIGNLILGVCMCRRSWVMSQVREGVAAGDSQGHPLSCCRGKHPPDDSALLSLTPVAVHALRWAARAVQFLCWGRVVEGVSDGSSSSRLCDHEDGAAAKPPSGSPELLSMLRVGQWMKNGDDCLPCW